MKKQILIRKMAISASIVLVASIVVLLAQFPYRHLHYKKRLKALNNHENLLISESLRYLDETAKRINNLPVDAKIIGDIQSYFLHKGDNPKLYLWMNDTQGNFLVGIPSSAFKRLNQMFDKYKHLIEKDDHYVSRNDFIINAISKYNKLKFSESNTEPILKLLESAPQWYDEKPYEHLLSKTVTDKSGRIIGEIYLKIDDEINRNLYQSRAMVELNDLYSALNPVFGSLIFFSAMFLWLLLPTWVYMDAKERDVKSPILWVVITVISTIWGLAIYLIIRPDKIKTLLCPKCKNELNGTRAFCPHCGLDLSNILCPQCQYPLKPEWSFCPSCRAEIKRDRTKTGEKPK